MLYAIHQTEGRKELEIIETPSRVIVIFKNSDVLRDVKQYDNIKDMYAQLSSVYCFFNESGVEFVC